MVFHAGSVPNLTLWCSIDKLNLQAGGCEFHLQSWRIRRFKPDDELLILARCLLHNRNNGIQVSFRRFDTAYPTEKVLEFLDRNARVQPSNNVLPAHLKFIESQSDEARVNAGQTQDRDEPASQVGPALLSGRGDAALHRRNKRKRQSLGHAVQFDSPEPPNQAGIDHSSQKQAPTGQPVEIESEDESRADGQTHEFLISEMELAFGTIKAHSKELDFLATDIDKLMRQPDTLRQQANDIFRRNQAREKQTDLGPLHHAALLDNIEMIDDLLAHGAYVNARGGAGYTALHCAGAEANFKALQALLAHDGVQINAIDDHGLTPLARAIHAKSPSCALLIARRGANVNIELPNGGLVLHEACMEKEMGVLIAEIIPGTRDLDRQEGGGNTPLQIAIYNRNYDYAEHLLEAGASINIPNKQGRTALHFACLDADAEFILKMINDEKTDCTLAGSEGETPLHILCQRDLSRVSQAVVSKAGVDINAQRLDGTTPLMLAAMRGSFETVIMLISYQANVRLPDSEGETALTMAIRSGHTEIAKFLVKNKSPLNPRQKTRAQCQAEVQSSTLSKKVSSTQTIYGRRQAILSRMPRSVDSSFTLHKHKAANSPAAADVDSTDYRQLVAEFAGKLNQLQRAKRGPTININSAHEMPEPILGQGSWDAMLSTQPELGEATDFDFSWNAISTVREAQMPSW